MITKCKCADYRTAAAEFQNKKYGAGMRAHNPQGGKNCGKFRCTVCGDEKSPSGQAPVTKGTHS